MEENDKETPKVQADHKSVAIGNIEIGGSAGDISIHAGDTTVYQYASEEDVPLTSTEIEHGLTCFTAFLSERAPVLKERFSSIDRKLRATLGAEFNALSPVLKRQRQDTVDEMKLMSMEVLDISFRALCTGQNPPPYDSRPPFLGLIAFRPENKEFYFGREVLIEKLVGRIQKNPFLAVMGASGSGKSSLVMAGLIPALAARMAYLTPSSTPLSQLQAAQQNAEPDTVFVVDQFEELFTLTHDSKERQQFIEALLEITKKNRVVITMRADFWGEVATFPDIKQAMLEHQELIAPMDTSELRSAVEQQAAAVGLRFDPALIESILDEVEGEPGAMPLLQHALWMLWKRRHGLWLKADEYRAFGGVKQAIASTAEEVYDSCPDLEQDLLRNIFLRLTRLDESGEGRDTRRRVLIEELIPANDNSNVAINLLNKLADSRLIVKTDKEAEVAHEALIRHWGRLTNWLREDRENLRLLEGLSKDAREWERSNHDESLLNHRGGRLELAVAMSQNSRYQLNPTEVSYLNACVDIQERAQIEKEKQQQRELQAAKKLAETAQAQAKAERRGRLVTVALLAIAIVLVIVLGYLSYDPIHQDILRRQALEESDLIRYANANVKLGNSQHSSNPNDAFYFYPEAYYPLSAYAIESKAVTYKRYFKCVEAGKCSPPSTEPSNYEGGENLALPAVHITAFQAIQFCKWLGRRLPTDKEWERADLSTKYFEWTSTSFKYDLKNPELTIEWTDPAQDSPEQLTIKGGGTKPGQVTVRNEQPAFFQDGTTSFRCATSR